MTEAEWAVCEPLLPAPAWLAGRGGRPASHCMRDIVDAIRYLTHNGPVWRALPADFPPAGTVYWWAGKWQMDGSAVRMHDDLRERVRLAAGRSSRPTAAVIDSQSVKGSEMVARAGRGYDAGKKINGTKRHLAVDALACCSRCWSPRRPCRTATRRSRCCGTCGVPFPPSSWPGPMAATPASWSPGPGPGCA
jgi:transposase